LKIQQHRHASFVDLNGWLTVMPATTGFLARRCLSCALTSGRVPDLLRTVAMTGDSTHRWRQGITTRDIVRARKMIEQLNSCNEPTQTHEILKDRSIRRCRVSSYLNAVLAEGDAKAMVAALGTVARARGMSRVAERAGLGRESLYKALSNSGNPAFGDRWSNVSAVTFEIRAACSAQRTVMNAMSHSLADRHGASGLGT
jgi:probable addiction module antidote protein